MLYLNRGGLNWRRIGIKFSAYVLLLAGILAMINYGLVMYGDWAAKYERVWQTPVLLSFQRPTFVRERPLLLSPVVIAVEDKEKFSPVEQKIIDKWGYRDGVLAITIFKCESGLRNDAVNWASRDIGITQINFPIWEKPIREKYGYTLLDLFNEDKNIEVAYWIWDRGNGIEGDGKGNFNAWVAFTSGSFRSCIQ